MTGKFDAMVTILNWLESGRTVTPQTIMDELSVSARTTYRYLTTLQEAEFPLFFDKERGSYAFAEGYALRKPHLNLRENLTFSLAKVSLKTMGGGMDKELARIERKLASPFRELPPHIIVAADEFSVDIREWFSIINRAIAERRRAAFTYTAASTREERARIVDPYYLFFHDGYWTLRGWRHTRREFRSFALDRIRELMALRFRKSIKLAPGIRMNLSGSGASFSFGGRGASVTVGNRGPFLNTGIPGTGISSRQKLDGPSSSRTSASSCNAQWT